jgi:hypothetical protein
MLVEPAPPSDDPIDKVTSPLGILAERAEPLAMAVSSTGARVRAQRRRRHHVCRAP